MWVLSSAAWSQRYPQGRLSMASDTRAAECLMSVIASAVLRVTQLSLYIRCSWWAFYIKQNVCSKPQVKSFYLILKSLFDIYLCFLNWCGFLLITLPSWSVMTWLKLRTRLYWGQRPVCFLVTFFTQWSYLRLRQHLHFPPSKITENSSGFHFSFTWRINID